MFKSTILLVSLIFASLTSYSQEYYEIYPNVSSEVQNKMNENKMNAVDVLTDIEAKHILVVSGMSISSKSELATALTNENIYSFEISDDMKIIKLSSKAKFKNTSIKTIFTSFGGEVNGQTTTYIIHEQ